jgi:hypothetical protein
LPWRSSTPEHLWGKEKGGWTLGVGYFSFHLNESILCLGEGEGDDARGG